MKRTLHFVYPFRGRISCPDAITREVTTRLRRTYNVINYDWAEFRCISPAPGDVLLGHACPVPFTVFRRSCLQPLWHRKILMSPFCPGEISQPAYNDPIIQHCDLYLAICGRRWFDYAATSEFSHWVPKMRHVDLAINREHFPAIKGRLNPPGKRRFVYIGSDAWYKNVPYLAEIARRAGDLKLDWIGRGSPLPGLESLGVMDFATPAARRLLQEYDFMVTAGSADANPTTILEAMAWGLIPVCTPQSGYEGFNGIINIPLNAPEEAAAILRRLNQSDGDQLQYLQQENWDALTAHFNWDRFAAQVTEAIESDESPICLYEPLSRRMRLRLAEVTFGFWKDLFNPTKLATRIRGRRRMACP